MTLCKPRTLISLCALSAGLFCAGYALAALTAQERMPDTRTQGAPKLHQQQRSTSDVFEWGDPVDEFDACLNNVLLDASMHGFEYEMCAHYICAHPKVTGVVTYQAAGTTLHFTDRPKLNYYRGMEYINIMCKVKKKGQYCESKETTKQKRMAERARQKREGPIISQYWCEFSGHPYSVGQLSKPSPHFK